MNKYIFFSFCVLLSLSVSAQTFSDSAYLQVTYLEDYSTRIENPKLKAVDEMVLNIGKTSSAFYSRYESRRQYMGDSVLAHGGDAYKSIAVVVDIPKGQNYMVYKNFPQQGQITFVDRIIATRFCYQEQFAKPLWTLVDEKKEVKGYNCQKAITNFRGREWTVWYTAEIPISDGPWKLCGLAGLILEAKDSDGLYSFHCIGIKQLDNKLPIVLPKKKMIKCTRLEYYHEAKEYAEQPELAIKKVPGLYSFQAYDEKGKKISCPTRTYFDMEKYE